MFWIILLVLLGGAAWYIARSRQDESGQSAKRYDTSSGDYAITVRTQYRTDDRDGDSWEGGFWEVEHPRGAVARLLLDYRDANGQRTERTVDVRQYGGFGNTTLMIGHCHLRNATRSFRVDRILQCVDVDTGEVVDDVIRFLDAKHETSPDRARQILLEDEYETLRVLLYVGKADGQLRAAERNVIRELCAAEVTHPALTDEMIDSALSGLDVPSLRAFQSAVRAVSKRDQTKRTAVLVAAERIVATQKTVHPSEQEALDYMRKWLQEPA